MLIQDVVASEWEFLRWSRLKLRFIQACATERLEEFLKSELYYALYRKRFAVDLTKILQDNFQEDNENGLQILPRDCALTETEAVDEVNKLLSSISLHMEDVHRRARVNRPKSSSRNTCAANPAPSR